MLRLRVPTVTVLVHKGESFFHMTYLSLVGWEAHGNYRYAAIGLLVTIVAGFFVHAQE